MEEREARLRLLEDELRALHAGISSHGGRIAQVKGWCVTVSSGLLVLAITQDRPALIVGAGIAVLAFWLAESQIASIQRLMILRQQTIERHFASRPALQALDDAKLALPGIAGLFIDPPEVTGWFAQVRFELTLTVAEARAPYRMFFYVLTLVGGAVVVVAASVL